MEEVRSPGAKPGGALWAMVGILAFTLNEMKAVGGL